MTNFCDLDSFQTNQPRTSLQNGSVLRTHLSSSSSSSTTCPGCFSDSQGAGFWAIDEILLANYNAKMNCSISFAKTTLHIVMAPLDELLVVNHPPEFGSNMEYQRYNRFGQLFVKQPVLVVEHFHPYPDLVHLLLFLLLRSTASRSSACARSARRNRTWQLDQLV